MLEKARTREKICNGTEEIIAHASFCLQTVSPFSRSLSLALSPSPPPSLSLFPFFHLSLFLLIYIILLFLFPFGLFPAELAVIPCSRLIPSLTLLLLTCNSTWDEFEVGESFYDCPEYCLVAECVGGGRKEEKAKIVGFVLASVLEKNQKIICG